MLFIDRYYDKKYGKIVSSALRELKSNKIYKGIRHSDCFVQRPKGELVSAEQGFLTEKGVFVNRKLGLKIAKHYGQIKQKTPPKNLLFSEDIF